MQYNQPMIDLVYAIRGHLTPSEKRSIKTTNPELLEDLADIYHGSENVHLRTAIEHLLRLAGATWFDLLKKEARTSKFRPMSAWVRPVKADVIPLHPVVEAPFVEPTLASVPAALGVH